jgi:hypothetical protein
MRIQLLGVAAALSLAAALTGCSSGATHAAVGVNTATRSSSPSAGESLPGADQLSSALLTANDLGPNFSAQPSDTSSPTNDTGKASGCRDLTTLMNETAPPSPSGGGPAQGQDQQVVLSGGQTGPFVGEFLSSRPSAVLDQRYPTAVNALKTCKELNVPTGSTTINFKLGDVDFGSPGSVAKHMTASVQGVPVNGYLAIDRLSPTVAFVYLYIQVDGDSPQTASGYYHQAITKADSVLGLTTPSQAA